jgi:hypothetical protein
MAMWKCGGQLPGAKISQNKVKEKEYKEINTRGEP